MESRELRYFISVAEEGNFTRAAARLFMTQPALSRAVRQMERELGAALFLRTHRGATLTMAGQVLLREGRAALEGIERAEARARAAGAAVHPGPWPPQGPAVRAGGRLPAASGDGVTRLLPRLPAEARTTDAPGTPGTGSPSPSRRTAS